MVRAKTGVGNQRRIGGHVPPIIAVRVAVRVHVDAAREARRERRRQRRRRWRRRRRRERVDLHLREVENPPKVSIFVGLATRQLDHHVSCHVRALAEQRANRIHRRNRLDADRPRVCGAGAIGDCVVPQSALAAAVSLATAVTVVHGDVGDLDRLAQVAINAVGGGSEASAVRAQGRGGAELEERRERRRRWRRRRQVGHAVRGVEVRAGVEGSAAEPRPGGARSVGIEENREGGGREGAVVTEGAVVEESQGEGLAGCCDEPVRIACKRVGRAVVASVIASGAALFQQGRIVRPARRAQPMVPIPNKPGTDVEQVASLVVGKVLVEDVATRRRGRRRRGRRRGRRRHAGNVANTRGAGGVQSDGAAVAPLPIVARPVVDRRAPVVQRASMLRLLPGPDPLYAGAAGLGGGEGGGDGGGGNGGEDGDEGGGSERGVGGVEGGGGQGGGGLGGGWSGAGGGGEGEGGGGEGDGGLGGGGGEGGGGEGGGGAGRGGLGGGGDGDGAFGGGGGA
eukprot:scaffold3452_cov61-Phaeocystis_antarctica.AAC.6